MFTYNLQNTNLMYNTKNQHCFKPDIINEEQLVELSIIYEPTRKENRNILLRWRVNKIGVG